MLKQLLLVVACAVFGAACGFPSLGALDGEADVEIVNAEGDGESAIIGSEAAEGSVDTGSGVAQLQGASDATDGAADVDDRTGGRPIERASIDSISLASSEAKMTADPGSPTRGWGYLTVDGAYSTLLLNGQAPAEGSKFVVVDYQLLGVESGNFFDQAFRLDADGRSYPPLVGINEIVAPGRVFNEQLVFEVPSSARALEFQGGVPLDSPDGFTAIFDIALTPVDPADPAPAIIPDDDIEVAADEIRLTGGETTMSIDLGGAGGGWADLTVDVAYSTAKIDEQGAGPDSKFVVIEFQLLGVEPDNLFETAFRLRAGDEWYSPRNGLNEILKTGEVFNGSLTFVVPRDTEDFLIEGGVPPRWTDGLTTTHEFRLPVGSGETGSGAAGSAVSGDRAGGSVDVEAVATGIALSGSEDRMSTNPADPLRGWGTLTIDNAHSTAKIEQNGARPGYKFIVIEYQLLGGASGNFFEEAFRLEANGELYSPLNGLNEVVPPGGVFNGSLVFEVPRSATTMTLDAGMVRGSADGYTAVFRIDFG